MNKKAKNIFFQEWNLSHLTFYFQNFMKGINIHQKSKKLQILMAKGWNKSFWVKNMEGQVFSKIFHCAPPSSPFITLSISLLEVYLISQSFATLWNSPTWNKTKLQAKRIENDSKRPLKKLSLISILYKRLLIAFPSWIFDLASFTHEHTFLGLTNRFISVREVA